MITETQADWAARKIARPYGDPRELLNALLIREAWEKQRNEAIARMKREAEARS